MSSSVYLKVDPESYPLLKQIVKRHNKRLENCQEEEGIRFERVNKRGRARARARAPRGFSPPPPPSSDYTYPEPPQQEEEEYYGAETGYEPEYQEYEGEPQLRLRIGGPIIEEVDDTEVPLVATRKRKEREIGKERELEMPHPVRRGIEQDLAAYLLGESKKLPPLYPHNTRALALIPYKPGNPIATLARLAAQKRITPQQTQKTLEILYPEIKGGPYTSRRKKQQTRKNVGKTGRKIGKRELERFS